MNSAVKFPWFGNLCQKFETMRSQIGDLSEEALEYVENQLETASANVEKFYSEIMQLHSAEVAAHDLSPEQIENMDPAVYGRSTEGAEMYSEKEHWDVNSLPHASFLESVEGTSTDSCSSSEQNANVWMYEKPNMVLVENPAEEKQSPSEISELVSSLDKNSSMELSCCEVSQSNHEEGLDDEDNLSTPILFEVEGCKSSTEARKSSNLLIVSDDTSSVPSASSVLVQSCEDFAIKSSWTEVQVCVGYAKLDADDVCREVAGDDSQTVDGELKLDNSCIVVNSDEICSISPKPALQSYKKIIPRPSALKLKLKREKECKQQSTSYEDLDPQNRPTVDKKLVLEDHEFSDAEWEII